MKNLEIYIHIPFCVRKCAYCDFVSGPADEKTKESYIECICREIREKGKLYSEDRRVSTIFFGGGTPSVIRPEGIEEILTAIRDTFNIEENAEISMEANPGTVTAASLSIYKRAGVNRLSMGLQSCDNRELALLGRIHSFEEFQESYELARRADFTNINIDLMSALPGQTHASYRDSLEKVIGLSPEHISAYSLIIEEGTPFYERYEEEAEARSRGEETKILPSEEDERTMYHDTEALLLAAGYEHYEISNYAKPGKACRHNIGYWDGTEYLGFGIAASSYINGRRSTNTSELSLYLAQKPLEITAEEKILSEEDRMEEFMFLGLRMLRGVSGQEFEKRFGKTMESVYGKQLSRFIKEGLLIREKDRYFLSKRGLDVANIVMAEFLFS